MCLVVDGGGSNIQCVSRKAAVVPTCSGEYTKQYLAAVLEYHMPQFGKSAKLYMERRLPTYQNTLRGPVPQLYLPDNPVNHLKLESPLPLPKFLYNRKYVTGGKTKPWPDGTCSNCDQ